MLTKEEIDNLKEGDKLILINMTEHDNENGFKNNQVVTFDKFVLKTLETMIGEELLIQFKEGKNGCNYGRFKYFRVPIKGLDYL